MLDGGRQEPMTTREIRLDIVRAVRIGLLGGIVFLYLTLVGLVGAFSERPLISGFISLGQTLLLLSMLGVGYITARLIGSPSAKSAASQSRAILMSSLAGFLSGGILAMLVIVGQRIDVREVFVNATTELYQILTFGRGLPGVWLFPIVSGVAAGVSAATYRLPSKIRSPIVWGLAAIAFFGLFSSLFRTILTGISPGLSPFARLFFAPGEGLTPGGALVFLIFAAGAAASRRFGGQTRFANAVRSKVAARPRMRWLGYALLVLVALLLPQVSGPFLSQVLALVGLYVLMGLGLNITLGFAGLFDLGFVAFFAIGAYTLGLLTSYGPQGLVHIPFWLAAPIAMLLAMLGGLFLGMPVLGIRGDYLAIATLGFGEIARLLVGSDFLARWLGGSQGIIGIQKPCIGRLGSFLKPGVPQECSGIEFVGPQAMYYVILVGVLIAALVAWRLRDARLGRAWMAVREDEDVAQALGINLVGTKLLAYSLGAGFAGLSGAIFATLVGSIFDSSMQLFVSINVVSLLIVGGMGSLPGVIVGALFLIGLPELLREFSEYRLLFYGLALIVMMQTKPEGLWPSATIRRELHAGLEAPNEMDAASADSV
jgi:branched-chain amino acid transport system permease protein